MPALGRWPWPEALRLAERLDSLGVMHSGVQNIQGNRGGPLIVLRDPDNIQVELTAGWHLSQRI
jgi:glyoxylase I family protein